MFDQTTVFQIRFWFIIHIDSQPFFSIYGISQVSPENLPPSLSARRLAVLGDSGGTIPEPENEPGEPVNELHEN